MTQKYPKHMECSEEAPMNRVESCHRQPRTEPAGLDEAKTYTDVYNIPHDPPDRTKR